MAFVDLVKIQVLSTGTDPFTLGPAVEGFRGADALVDGEEYSYSVQQGGNYEYGRGVYSQPSGIITRAVLGSSRNGQPVDFSVGAIVTFTLLSIDLEAFNPSNPVLGVSIVAPGLGFTFGTLSFVDGILVLEMDGRATPNAGGLPDESAADLGDVLAIDGGGNPAWLPLGALDVFPDQTGNAGKVLTTDGDVPSWETPPSGLPDQSGSAGKFLSTDGTTASWTSPIESIIVAASDEATNITAGTAKVTFRMPYAFTLTAVRASLSTAQASGAVFTVGINEGGASILSTKLTIDNTEKTSVTAATPPVISDANLADDAEITIDVDQVGTAGAKGLKVYLIGRRA